jgi:hypothetical protein
VKILCKDAGGADLFVVDFMVMPNVGDVVSRSDGASVRQRWRVAQRVHLFAEERDVAPCLLILEAP